jgi:hypothetical protein
MWAAEEAEELTWGRRSEKKERRRSRRRPEEAPVELCCSRLLF